MVISHINIKQKLPMSCASWGKGGTDTQVYLDLHDLDLCEKLCYLSLIFPFPYVHNIMNLFSWNFHVLFRYTWQRSISHFCTWWPWPCTDWPQNWSVLITEDIKTSFTWSLPQSYSCSRNMKDITCSLKKTDTSSFSLTFSGANPWVFLPSRSCEGVKGFKPSTSDDT